MIFFILNESTKEGIKIRTSFWGPSVYETLEEARKEAEEYLKYGEEHLKYGNSLANIQKISVSKDLVVNSLSTLLCKGPYQWYKSLLDSIEKKSPGVRVLKTIKL